MDLALFRFYTDGFVNISGGSVNVDWEITCQGGRCPDAPGRKLRRGWATIPCGSAESGPVDGIIPQSNPMIPVTVPTTVTLTVTGVNFVRWDGMDGRPKFNSYDGICKDGVYANPPSPGINPASLNLNLIP